MQYLKRQTRKNGDDAVSPVVGVMLMLVVTIIIAAVVSGFAGGLIGGQQKAPSMSMDVKIANSGTWVGSGFTATVTSVSEPIATKNLKIVTSWKSGKGVVGGNTSTPGTKSAYYMVPASGGTGALKIMIPPFGSGPGVVAINPTAPYTEQQFGNYTLVQGTGLYANPFGTVSDKAIGGSSGASSMDGYGVTTPYAYNGSASISFLDATQAVLGGNWQNLRAGDTVSVSVVHIPSGKVIFQKDVAVSEG